VKGSQSSSVCLVHNVRVGWHDNVKFRLTIIFDGVRIIQDFRRFGGFGRFLEIGS